ncbi:DUF1217 domain-containing protein [Arvimicrobium flavum]|uniref:DUF1217 domain-containing protein n=1 Tax=Arvimicrobium flavum TaxID=3393320 RepID=UPI00237B3E4B|nr:DUF1217 domain-containing protein [Mesorhizobium shangrilense]
MNTYTSYSLIMRDIAKSIDRVGRDPIVSRDTEYYMANIGKVSSIDEFVNDYRLFSYAMKAHGLEDMTYAKAFMVKVLEGGVTDPDSFANRLSDKRYVEFAKTFDFKRNGAEATTYNRAQADVPKNFIYQTELTTGQANYAYVEEETSYFLENIGNVKSVDDLLGDARLLRYALTASNIYLGDYATEQDPTGKDHVRAMLEGGVADPQSPANKLGDKRFANFVSVFNFVEYGADSTSRLAVQMGTPQSFIQESELVLFKGVSDTQRAEVAYFTANIGKVATAGQLISDKRLLTFALAAYGLDARTEPPERVLQMLTGGVSDPQSPANQLSDKRYAAFVSAFNFAEHGAAATSRDEATQLTPKRYLEQQADPESAYFRANISTVKSVGDLLRNERLITYAMKAYGLDAKAENRVLVRDMLLGGVTDPNSPANQSSDKRWAAFVSAFDFAQHGADATSRAAVTEATPRLYVENLDPETAYFRANIGKVTTVDKLLADTRLLTYATAAYGLDASTQGKDTIRKMLVGGVDSPTSPANLLDDKSYARFVAAFDFKTHGVNTTSQAAVLEATPTRYDTMRDLGLVKLPAAYVKAETDYYKANVGKLESIDDLMADKRLLNYALVSYGFDPADQSPAKIRQMLEGGVKEEDSPAKKSGDSRWVAFVSAFNFVEHGEETTTFSLALKPTIDKFMRQTLEENAGNTNEGVRLALYFERKAPKISNFYEVLADPALAKVARTVLSLPDSFANADLDRQVKLFESRLDIQDFSEPDKLAKFLTRFTSMWEIGNPSAPTAASLAASLIAPSPAGYGVSADTLFAIQNLRR